MYENPWRSRVSNYLEEGVESYTVDNIKEGGFILKDYLENLDKSLKLRMVTIGEALMAYLRDNLEEFCDLKEIGNLSEDLIIKLLKRKEEEENKDVDVESEEMEEEEEEEEEESPIFRFKAFVTWLSVNSMAEDKKEKTLAMFDFEEFTAEELASDVKNSRLYPSDKIIERMEQLFKKQRDLYLDMHGKYYALKYKTEKLW